MTIPEIRKALNVPKDLRILQHIYNVMKEGNEMSYQINMEDPKTYGLDIFNVEDEEFISKLSK